VARSALIAPQSLQDLRGSFTARLERQWRGKVIEALSTSDEVARRLELRQRPASGHRRKKGDRTTTVGDLDRLARLDTPKQFARALSQLSHPHTCHVLFVAHMSLIRPDQSDPAPY